MGTWGPGLYQDDVAEDVVIPHFIYSQIPSTSSK